MGGCRDLAGLPEAIRLRLGVLAFRIPPLRERREDILSLVRAFLEAHARKDGRPAPTVERAVERELLRRDWPGNVRQLQWTVIQALGVNRGPILASLPPDLEPGGAPLVLPFPEPGTLAGMLDVVTRAAEAALLRRALEGRQGDPAAAAQELGLTPRALAKALRDHGIPLEE
jgi:DNA-binding NtrC family response regulator